MNDFRDRILGHKPLHEPLLRAKTKSSAASSRAAEEESFSDLTIPREEGRQANHRESDRHRLADEQVELVHAGAVQRVTLINLSGGGAMIEGASNLKLWDRVELRLSEWSRVEAAVRWIRGARFGLEFAHETRVEAETVDLQDMLRAVIQRSFPDVQRVAETPVAEQDSAEPSTVEEVQEEQRQAAERELRHPLIWSGLVHYNHSSIPVRLRNISAGGALVEVSDQLPCGAELLLDLDEAGTMFATVHWARGDAAGLKFHSPFDIRRLADARPKVTAPTWVAPDYLHNHSAENSPWARQWGRSDLDALRRRLGPERD